ncbi:unnamed protein product [Camellia sinensis]
MQPGLVSEDISGMRDMGEEEDSTHTVPESPLIPRFGMGIELIGKQNKEWDWDASKTIEELKKQVWLGGPLVVVSLLQYSLQMISVMFIGHLGELSLSSASMAISFAEVTGFSFLMGTSIKKVVFTDEMVKGLKRWRAKAKKSLARRNTSSTLHSLDASITSLDTSPSFNTLDRSLSVDLDNLSIDADFVAIEVENEDNVAGKRIEHHQMFGSFRGFDLSGAL